MLKNYEKLVRKKLKSVFDVQFVNVFFSVLRFSNCWTLIKFLYIFSCFYMFIIVSNDVNHYIILVYYRLKLHIDKWIVCNVHFLGASAL